MSRKLIDLGTGYDTQDGDRLRDGGGFINANFIEVYRRATEWAPQTYDARTTVLRQNVLYFLSFATPLPFNSSNFDNELANGTWIAVGSGGPGEAPLYTNTQPVPEKIGGIEVGETFDEVPLTEMWDKLLYPYMNPALSNFIIQGQATSVEVGHAINAGNYTFIWESSNDANIVPNSLEIKDNTADVVLETGMANDHSESVALTEVIKMTPAANVWGLTGQNTESGLFSTTFTVNWLWRSYFGSDVDANLLPGAIPLLDSTVLTSSRARTYPTAATATPEFRYISYPSEFGIAAGIKDEATGFDVAMNPSWNPAVMDIVTSFGITVEHNVYRTANQTSGVLNMIVT